MAAEISPRPRAGGERASIDIARLEAPFDTTRDAAAQGRGGLALTDLEREFAASGLDALKRSDLERRGIAWPMTYLVGQARVEWAGDRYQPTPDGTPAWIFAARLEVAETGLETTNPQLATIYGETVDLVAVEPGPRGRVATRRGAVAALGNVEPQIFQPEPVPVWRSVWNWLRAGGGGLVLVSADILDRYEVLSSLGAIIAEDVGHGREIERILRHPFRRPPILIRDQAPLARRCAA